MYASSRYKKATGHVRTAIDETPAERGGAAGRRGGGIGRITAANNRIVLHLANERFRRSLSRNKRE
jgi:hypothetical protein